MREVRRDLEACVASIPFVRSKTGRSTSAAARTSSTAKASYAETMSNPSRASARSGASYSLPPEMAFSKMAGVGRHPDDPYLAHQAFELPSLDHGATERVQPHACAQVGERAFGVEMGVGFVVVIA